MKTPRLIAAFFLVLLLAATAQAGDRLLNFPSASNTPGNTLPGYTGPLTVTGPLTLNESPGPELVTLDTTCTGWTLPAGWACSSGTVTHNGAGTGAATYSLSGGTVVGTVYRLSMTHTVTDNTGGLAVTLGGASGTTRTASGTLVDYIPAATTGTLSFAPGSAYRNVITAISVKALTNTITPSAGPIVATRTLADAAANEAATTIISNQTGAAGDKTTLKLVNIGSGSGAEYLMEGYNGSTRTYSLTQAGTGTFANIQSTTIITSSMPAPGADGAFYTAPTWSSTATGRNSVAFRAGPMLPAMDGSDTEIMFNAAPTNGNHTGAGNALVAYNAADITGDAEATEAVVKIGTGWDLDIQTSVTAEKAFTKTPLTNNSATDLFTITLAAGESIAGHFEYGLTATGGSSDIQSHSGSLFFVCVNKGGTFTNDINETYTNANDTSVLTAGTLADTWAMKAGDVCTVTLNMNSSLSSAVNTVTGKVKLMSVKPLTLN